MKQYMPLKPVKRGFKVWVRADAVNGYFCDFDVYVGRPADGVSVETGLGDRVVTLLMEPLRGRHYQVYCDNFLSTCRLFSDLLSRGTYACGTTRTNRRGYPDTLKGVTMERGDQAGLLPAGQSGCVSVDGQKTCNDPIHAGTTRHSTHCTQTAEGRHQTCCTVL